MTDPAYRDTYSAVKPNYVERAWTFPAEGMATYTISHHINNGVPWGWRLNQVGSAVKSIEEIRALAKWMLSVVGEEND